MENVNYVGIVTITEEDIRRADSYLPLMRKTAIVQLMAEQCLEKVELGVPVGGTETTDGTVDPVLVPVPELYQESALMRTLSASFVLLYFYLKMPDITSHYDPNGAMFLAANDYDRYRGPMTQLERLKATCRDQEVRNKLFELLSDYKDFERRLGLAIHSLITVRNDLCSRATAMLAVQTAPDTIQNALAKSDELAHAAKEAQRAGAAGCCGTCDEGSKAGGCGAPDE